MITFCLNCNRRYDDAEYWTICPHGPLWAGPSAYCKQHDLVNCPLHKGVEMDFTRASELTPEVEKEIENAFLYHPWDETKTAKGTKVREALAAAVKVIVAEVPPSPDRSAAIRKLRDARMDCNSAITHDGKY